MSEEKQEVLLLIRIAGTAIHFVAEWSCWKADDNLDPEHWEYFVGEHTCPTNLLRAEAFLHQGDADPHGIFEFVQAIERPADYDESRSSQYDYWAELFSLLPSAIVENKPSQILRLGS